MAQRVPGMVPVQDDRRRLDRLGGRAQTPDASRLRPVSLQPAAQPVDTYVRPERQDNSSGLFALADALAAIQPSVKQFAQRFTEEPDDRAGRARQYILENGIEKVNSEIASGNTPEPFKDLAGMEVFAKEMMYRDLAEATRLYNENADRDNLDMDAFLRETIQPTMDQYGEDRAFRDIYMRGIMEGFENLKAKQFDYQTQRTIEARYDTVFRSWAEEMRYKVAEGVPPAEIMESIASTIPTNKQFLGMHPKDQQKMLLQLASDQFTLGNYDMAKTILDFERTDGPYKGSLRTDRSTADAANTLWTQIDAEQTKARMAMVAKEAEDQAYTMGLDMVLKGSILSATDVQVPDERGELKTIKAETFQKEVANKALSHINTTVAAIPGLTDEQRQTVAMNEEKRIFSNSGLRHPVWFDTMNSAWTQMSNDVQTLEGPMPPSVTDSFRLYRELNSYNPSYLSKHLDGKAQDFYATADALLQTGRYADEAAALKAAAQVNRNPALNDAMLNASYADIDAKMAEIVSGSGASWWQVWDDTPDAKNGGDVRQFVSDKARLFAKAGLDPTEAITKAGELFEKTHVNVLGGYVPLTKNTPPDFAPLAEQYVTEWLEANPDALAGGEIGDVFIRQFGNGDGAFSIVGPDGLPLNASFTYRDLEALRQRNREKAAEEAATPKQ